MSSVERTSSKKRNQINILVLSKQKKTRNPFLSYFYFNKEKYVDSPKFWSTNLSVDNFICK